MVKDNNLNSIYLIANILDSFNFFVESEQIILTGYQLKIANKKKKFIYKANFDEIK